MHTAPSAYAADQEQVEDEAPVAVVHWSPWAGVTPQSCVVTAGVPDVVAVQVSPNLYMHVPRVSPLAMEHMLLRQSAAVVAQMAVAAYGVVHLQVRDVELHSFPLAAAQLPMPVPPSVNPRVAGVPSAKHAAPRTGLAVQVPIVTSAVPGAQYALVQSPA